MTQDASPSTQPAARPASQPARKEAAALPLISVIIPTLNRPDLLMERALSSAFGQTHHNLEVLVIVDGPDPGTQAALNRVQDPRLRVHVLPVNSGPSDARNAGVQLSRGEWIALLDDDDEWFPDKLARQLECALKSRHAFPVVFSGWITRTPAGDTLNPHRLKPQAQPFGDYLLARTSPALPECFLTTSMTFAPKELLTRLPFSAGMRKHEDWDWMLRAEQVPGVGFEQLPLHETSALAVYHHAENRHFASQHTDWAPSLAWAQGHREAGRLSERAFAGFIVAQLAPFPAAVYDLQGFLTLSRALRSTRPNLYEALRYLKLWVIPAPVRRTLKNSLLQLTRLVKGSSALLRRRDPASRR